MKTIALGVDGMEPSLCDRWTDKGYLSNIDKIRQKGAYGTATCSSLVSAKQWTTHFTGVGPKQHGVYGFLSREEIEHQRDDRPYTRLSPDTKKLINLSDIQVKTYPEILSEGGTSVGLINPLPIWPAMELSNGFCICGMVTPPTATSYTYPQSLAAELDELGYRIDVRYGNRPYGFIDDLMFSDEDVCLEELRSDMFDVLESRIEYTKRTIDDDQVEFLYSLLKTVDIIQHTFWAHMEADHPRYGETILECYRKVDELIGWIRNQLPGANLVVFGDHGFGPRRDPRFSIVHSVGYLIDSYLDLPYSIKALYRKMLKAESDPSLDDLDGITGDHSNPTACMMAGPDIESGALDITFEDITPSIFALLDEPIPNRYLGTVPSQVDNQNTTRRDVSLDVSRSRPKASDDVSERLYNLGYAEMVEE